MRAQITSTGLAAPPQVETAEQLAPQIGRTADWIVHHTGVVRRHIAATPSMEGLAASAARRALGDGPPPDLLLNASVTPRQMIPDSSVFIQRELALSGVPSFSVHATCLSFLVGLHNAAALIAAGAYRRILLVSSEVGSVSRDFSEPESAALIGDGAGAAIIEPTPAGGGSAILGYQMATWHEGAELTELRGGGIRRHPNNPDTTPEDNRFQMNGPGVYKMARRRVAVVLKRLLQQADVQLSDIDLVVPHQASGPALNALRFYGFAADRVVNIIAEYGNCIAASLPMALAVAQQEGRLKRGDTILLLGTGAGLSVGGALLRW
ncbi:MAG: ketoacyl-ACP synthase III [Myxococcota bacterium]